jgi:GWxTD domain-containing protein
LRKLRFVLLLLMLPTWIMSVAQKKSIAPRQLAPHFRQWIEEDVPYIITQDERREFLRLQTDDERDKYVEQFWESRNPTPHSSINTFKEEHYRRLAYVRSEFGDERYNDGWRTDMGRVYITLGAPQQKSIFHQGMSTRPVEIWFYQAPSPALPAFFNLVFYKRSEADPYTLYSPRDDGPTKVVTNDLHEDAKALRTIDKSMGPEATHAMVSLIPGEPINIDHPSPTMSSDLLLDAVRNLPEQKLEKERIARQRMANRELVTSNVFTGSHAAELQTVVLHDEFGRSTVHYTVVNQQPDAALIGLLPDKRTGYELTLTTRVMTGSGAAVYESSDRLTSPVSPDGAKAGREKKFAAEGRLPLVPGNYTIESVLTNNITHDSTRTSAKISVPSRQADAIAMSGLIVYAGRALQMSKPQLPFTLAGLRFPPRGEQVVELHAGERLPLVFQLWLPQTGPATTPAIHNSIHLHYVLGSVASSSADASRIEEDQDAPATDADHAGNLVTGKTLDTTNLRPGTYRLVVRATETGSPHSAFATMTVKVVPSQVPVDMWTAYSDDQRHPLWQDDLLRGIAAEAQKDDVEAASAYRRVLALNPSSADAQKRLNALTQKVAQHSPNTQ